MCKDNIFPFVFYPPEYDRTNMTYAMGYVMVKSGDWG